MKVLLDNLRSKDCTIDYFRAKLSLNKRQKKKFADMVERKYGDNELRLFKNKIVDIYAVSELVNMDCMNCHKLNPYGCCDSSPMPVIPEEARALVANMSDIVEDRFTKEEMNNLIAYGTIYEYEDGTMVPLAHDHGCAFLMTAKNGSKLCAIKNWCLTNDIDIVGICPSSCLLFPMDILEIHFGGKTIYYITSVMDEEYNRNFARWGPETGNGFQCLGRGYVLTKYRDKIFKKDDFIPLYKEFESLLRSWFDDETYEFIEKECEE